MKTAAILLAGGNGTRFGKRKQWLTINGESVTARTIRLIRPYVNKILLLEPQGDYEEAVPGDIVGIEIIQSGPTRFDGMKIGFSMVPEGWNVLIVDAVRCNTPTRIIKELVEKLDRYSVAYPAVKAENTVCHVRTGGIVDVVNKNGMYEIQTPTAVRYQTMRDVLKSMKSEDGFAFVYGAWRAGIKDIVMVEGSRANLKLTYPEDLGILEGLGNAG